MLPKPQADRAEFVAHWAEYEADPIVWRTIRPYLLYPGYLAICVAVARMLDPEGRFIVPTFGAAVAYVVLAPYLWIRSAHARFGHLIRCRSCGVWFGQDEGGAYRGPGPIYRAVIATGRCGGCGAVVLSDAQGEPQAP